MSDLGVYLDNAATTPVDPRVADEVMRYMSIEFGNAGSVSHAYGNNAKAAVERARGTLAKALGAQPSELLFTGGATESNNLAILGLRQHALASGKTHVVSSAIEHKSVLEPLAELEKSGFEVTRIKPQRSGVVDLDEFLSAIRPKTSLCSLMHVNNETGAIEPITELANALSEDGPFLHVDASQSFGKQWGVLEHPRIDFVSISGHKLCAPKGIGALLVRRARAALNALHPIMVGGGQERGLRPGTLPVPLIVGLGVAAELAMAERKERAVRFEGFRAQLLGALLPLGAVVNGELERCQPNILNVAIPGLDSEAAMLALKGVVAISNGSACTSSRRERSHVLAAMGLPTEQIDGALRFSWSHLTERTPVETIADRLRAFV